MFLTRLAGKTAVQLPARTTGLTKTSALPSGAHGRQRLWDRQQIPQSVCGVTQPPEHVFRIGLHSTRSVATIDGPPKAKDLPPHERRSTKVTTRVDPNGCMHKVPQFAFHGTNQPPEVIFSEGLSSPDRNDDFALAGPDAVKLALTQNTTTGDEGFEIALRQDTPYYGHQFVSLSKDHGLAAQFATRRAMQCNPGEDAYMYEIDVEYLLIHGFKVYDVNRDAYSHCDMENEIAVLHYTPPEAIKQAWVGRWDGPAGGFVPDREPIPNARYGKEPTPQPSERFVNLRYQGFSIAGGEQ